MGELLSKLLPMLLEESMVLLRKGVAKVLPLMVVLGEAAAGLLEHPGRIGKDLIERLVPLLARGPLAQEALTRWLLLLWQAFSTYWLLLFALVAIAIALAVVGHIPLVWRAIVARRRAVFISFQNAREVHARGVESVLKKSRFHVLRVPYMPEAEHQSVVTTVNRLLRSAQAMICLPGSGTSFVEAEVSAATFAHKPILFLMEANGTLPNTADKRHPVFDHDKLSQQGYAPVAEFLHEITQDFKSACRLYRRAWTHPALGVALRHVLVALVFAWVVLFAIALLHGHFVTAGAPIEGVSQNLRFEAILLMAVALLAGAVVLLPLSTWLVLVTRALVLQLRAARRAALQASEGEFSRSDWVSIVPDMAPGRPLYDCMWVSAPKAHHEVAQPAL